MNIRLTVLFILGISSCFFGQKEWIATFPVNNNPSIIHQEVRNDSVAVYLGNWSLSYFYNFDVNNPNLSTPTQLWSQQNLVEKGTSLFFTTFEYEQTGTNGHHKINFQDFQGNQFVSVPINDYLHEGSVLGYEPKFPTLFNNEYYIVGYHNSEYCIWKSNGTLSGTSVVAHYSAPIKNMEMVNDKLVYYTQSATQYTFYSLQAGGTPTIITQIPISNNYPVIESASYHQRSSMFFRMTDASNNYSIWAIDSAATNFSLFRDSCNTSNVEVRDSSFFIYVYDESTGLNERYKGNLSDPSTIVLAPFVYNNVPGSSYVHSDTELGNGYMESNIANKGKELSYRMSDDSLHLIKDFIPGMGSGLVSFISVNDDSVALTVQSLGGRPFICRIDRDSILPLFYVDDRYSVKYAFEHNSYMYWYESELNGPIYLYRRLLTDLDPIDLNPQDSLTWYKEIGVQIKNGLGNMYMTSVYNEGVFIDNDNAVLSAFTTAQTVTENYVVEDADGGLQSLKGRDIITKRDQFGNLQWVKTLGGSDDNSDHGLMTKTIHDDVLVLNDYGYKAYFENDSMMFTEGGLWTYLVKLSNEDGSILWKRNLFPYADNYYYSFGDGLVSDEKGNIYVTFLYFGFEAMIEDYEITSDVSPTNALAKLDSNGNVIWVENIPTPWTDSYGNTTVLKWNEEKQTVLVVQTQAEYNTWSSCDYTDFQTFVQTIDTAGVVLDTFNYTADDLSGIITGVILPNNNYFLSGYYRGKLDIGDYSTISEPTDNCFQTEGYQLGYSPESGEPVSLVRSHEIGFNPVSSVLNDGFVYVIGSDNGGHLKIVRFTDKGIYSGYLPLNQIEYTSDFWGRHNYLDVKNGYIVIQSQRFFKDSVYNVYPYTPNVDPTSNVLRIENKGWIMDDYFDHQSIHTNTYLNWSSNLEVIVYPNPFGNTINLQFKTPDHGYDSYQLYDVSGRLVKTGPINQAVLEQSIDINLTSSGMYVLHLEGSAEDAVFKLTHSN